MRFDVWQRNGTQKPPPCDAHLKSSNLRGLIWLLIIPVLLGCQAMAPIENAGQSADPYKGSEFPTVSARWTREARIYRGFDVELIAAATFKTASFRKAFADEYERVFLLTESEKNKLLRMIKSTRPSFFMIFCWPLLFPKKSGTILIKRTRYGRYTSPRATKSISKLLK